MNVFPTSLFGATPDWRLRTYLFLSLLFIWRLVFIHTVPLDLAPDEAYYWDWSRYPDWGYYSKPPLIAWINSLSSSLLPLSDSTVRLPAALLSCLSLLFLYALARRLFSDRTAFWAVLAAAASPGSAALGFLMTIDAPLLFFWSLSLYVFWRALEDSKKRIFWWLVAGCTVGFGLLSKQIMLVFIVIAPLFLLLSENDRYYFRTPFPYLFVLIALMALLPPICWNIKHDWITFQHTAHHFDGNPKEAFYFIKTFLGFIGGQLLLISPLTCLLFGLLSICLLRNFAKQGSRVRFLILFSSFCLLFFLLMSLRQRINANWPAAFYPSGMILLAAWACGEISGGQRTDRWRKLFFPGVAIGCLFCLLTYVTPYLLGNTSLGGSRLDPTARVKGWRQLARKVEKVRHELPKQERTFLVATRRKVVSELAFYLPDRPRVYKWTGSYKGISSQYDLWPTPENEKRGWDGLIILKATHEMPQPLANSFVSIRKLGRIEIILGPGGKRGYDLYLGRDLLSWQR